MTDNDKCCICGKVLFIDGERQTELCYHIGLSRKRILKDGCYADGSECAILICKSCLSRNNNEAIMSAIWKGHERAKRIRKQRGCNTDLKQSLDLANERETEWANRIEGLKTDLEYAKAIIKDLLDNSHEYARQNAEDFIKGEKRIL